MDTHSSDRLRPRLQDADAAVREHAVRALARIGAWGGNDALAMAFLQCASSDPHAGVQRAAADELVGALNGEQATSARAVMRRVLENRPMQVPPLVVMLLHQSPTPR